MKHWSPLKLSKVFLGYFRLTFQGIVSQLTVKNKNTEKHDFQMSLAGKAFGKFSNLWLQPIGKNNRITSSINFVRNMESFLFNYHYEKFQFDKNRILKNLIFNNSPRNILSRNIGTEMKRYCLLVGILWLKFFTLHGSGNQDKRLSFDNFFRNTTICSIMKTLLHKSPIKKSLVFPQSLCNWMMAVVRVFLIHHSKVKLFLRLAYRTND